MLVTGELLIVSLGDYHKVTVSCVSYPWPHIYDYRVSYKDSVLDLHILSDSLFGIANACNCIHQSKYHSASTSLRVLLYRYDLQVASINIPYI